MNTLKKYFALSFAVIALSFVGVSAQNYAGGAKRSEQSVERQIHKKLRGLPRYGVFDHITYQINGSTVTLEGKVITLGTKSAAARAVRDISGVTEVVNNIDELPPGSFDDQIRREAYRSFVTRGPGQYFHELNPDVRIIVENGRITLEGYVYREADSNLLNILANGVSGTFKVTNNLLVGKRAA